MLCQCLFHAVGKQVKSGFMVLFCLFSDCTCQAKGMKSEKAGFI